MLSLRLALFAIKKKKESCIVLTLFILLAVLFMDLSLSVNSRAQQIFFEKTEELHEVHFIAPCTTKTYKTEYEDFIKGAEGVTEFEKEEAVIMPTTTNNCNELELGAFFYNKDADRQLAPFHLIKEDPSVDKTQAIYVPVQLESEHVLLGQPYELTYRGTTYSFIVAGYFETTTYCNINSGFYKYYIPDESYQGLSQEAGKAYMLAARFAGNEAEVLQYSENLKVAFLRDTTYASDQQNLLQNALCYEDLQVRTVLNLLVGVAIIFAVSILICMVVLFIIMNFIREEIHKTMAAIGTLQAMGYTLGQIMRSYLYEYLLLGCVGGVLGIACSYLSHLFMAPFLTGLCGFEWQNFVHPLGDLGAFVIVLGMIGLISLAAVRRMRRLTPVIALNQRNGSKKGYRAFFPLQKGKLPLNLHIAIKNLIVQLKSNVVYTLIVAIGSFTIGVAFILLLNFSAHTDALMSVIGLELADLQVKVSQGCDAQAFAEELMKRPEVRKTNASATGAYLKYENEAITTLVEEDFDKLEYVNPYEGDMPQTQNEVLISSFLSKTSGKGVGDSITFHANGVEKNYLVCGIFSSTNGFVAYMKEQGIRLLYPDFVYNGVDVYLEDGVSPETYKDILQTEYKVSVDHSSTSVAEEKIARLLADYGVSSVSYSIWKDGVEICSGNSSAFLISEITDLKSFADAQLQSYSRILSSMVMVIFVTMLLIIGCVLQVTTKSEIQKNRTEYGTLKAIGYTTRDIISQVALRFLLTTMLGSLVGALLAYMVAPALFQAIFALMGVTQVAMNAYPYILLLYSCVLCVVLYLVARFTCRRIKNISVYELLTE